MRTLAGVTALLLLAAPASAKQLKVVGIAEGALGVSIPAADSDYRRFASPTFKLSLRGGAELWLSDLIGVAPDLQIDLIPVKTNDATYRSGNFGVDTPFFRARFLFGARLLIALSRRFPLDAFFRFAIGADYLTGSETASFNVGPIRGGGTINLSSTAFTLEPGFGLQFRFLRYGAAGVYAGFPVAFHDFGRADAGNVRSFTAVDVDLLGFIGARI